MKVKMGKETIFYYIIQIFYTDRLGPQTHLCHSALTPSVSIFIVTDLYYFPFFLSLSLFPRTYQRLL